jgi:RNA polymerase sigma-70 factor (sigma-E family)
MVEGFRSGVSPSRNDEYVEFLSSRLPRLTQTSYLLCGDRHRAEDIVQAMAMKLYVKWRQARAADNLDGYVHRMLVREFSRQRRLGWSRVMLTDRLPERPVVPSDHVEDRDTVLAGLAQLPAGQRAVIVLRFFSDLSVADTAVALNCTTGNVKSQTARGLASLRRIMAQPVDRSLR